MMSHVRASELTSSRAGGDIPSPSVDKVAKELGKVQEKLLGFA